jgi:class 3 adenylate cyclase
MVTRLGDQAWADLLRAHNQRIRAIIDRAGGKERGSFGDGFLALFDGAARAVRAAAAMDAAVADLGMRVRAGVHTGEVTIVGGQALGVAVHAAARIASLAGPAEVLVSGTTQDAMDGSGLVFEFRGAYELKGLTGARAIFALVR